MAWKKACDVGKRTFAEFKDFFFGSDHLCLVCYRGLTVDSSASLVAQYFCSSDCYKRYLVGKRDLERWEKCLKFGCNRTRGCSEYRVFDYCTRSHAEEHKQWLARFWSKDATGRICHGDGYSQGSRGHRVREKGLVQSEDYGGSSTTVLFYRRGQPYFEFTNFAEYPIVVDELQYPTSEHYFQSQKLIGTPYVAHICQLPTAREAFEFPRQPHVSRWIRHDWEHVKDDVMYRALVAKFWQHRRLQFLLLDTGNRKLVEHSPYDSYWGDGPDGKGLNRLGELLMRVRELLIFIRDQGGHVLREDHTTDSATTDSSSQHSSNPCTNSPLPDRRHVEADGGSAPPGDNRGLVSNNDGVCRTPNSEVDVGANQVTSPPACSSATPGSQVKASSKPAGSSSSTPEHQVGASSQPLNCSSSTPENQVGASLQSVNRSSSTSGDHTETNGNASSQAAHAPSGSLPSLDSSGVFDESMDSATDSSHMEVCQDSGNGTPSNSQETNQAEQPALADTEEKDEDIVTMQMAEKSAEKMGYTLV